MAETAVEIPVCNECGADVRDESSYCYNCGAAVQKVSSSAGKPIPERAVLLEEPREMRPPLRSAASLRKHRRALNRQPVQVMWERPEGPPMAFIIATIVLTIGALVLLILAFYLR